MVATSLPRSLSLSKLPDCILPCHGTVRHPTSKAWTLIYSTASSLKYTSVRRWARCCGTIQFLFCEAGFTNNAQCCLFPQSNWRWRNWFWCNEERCKWSEEVQILLEITEGFRVLGFWEKFFYRQWVSMVFSCYVPQPLLWFSSHIMELRRFPYVVRSKHFMSLLEQTQIFTAD